MMKKYIVSKGDISNGFRFYGAFDTYEQAFDWGLTNFESGFVVSELWGTE
jgi:hypothetical protein